MIWGVPGAIAGTWTVRQQCVWIKEFASPKPGHDVGPAEESCGRSPIITSRRRLRPPAWAGRCALAWPPLLGNSSDYGHAERHGQGTRAQCTVIAFPVKQKVKKICHL
jgi:hypothetical protein